MEKKSLAMIIGAGIFWGTSPLFVKGLEGCGFNSWQMTFFRYGVSSLFMIFIVLLSDRSYFKIKKEQILWILCSGIALYCTSSFYYTSITHSSPATAVSLMYTSPAIITLYSVLFMKEKFNAAKGFALVSSIIGSALVAGFPFNIKSGFLGIFFGVMSAFLYSTYCIISKFQAQRKFPTTTVTVYNFIIVAVISLLFSNPSDLCSKLQGVTLIQISLIAGVGISTATIPYFLYNLSLKKVPVSVSSVLTTMEPMTATVFSVLFLGEKLTFLSLIGIFCILASAVVLALCKE